jgi:hypothetical protein
VFSPADYHSIVASYIFVTVPWDVRWSNQRIMEFMDLGGGGECSVTRYLVPELENWRNNIVIKDILGREDILGRDIV